MVFWIGMYMLLGIILDCGLSFGVILWAFYKTRSEEAINNMLDILYNGSWMTKGKKWISEHVFNPHNKVEAACIIAIAFILWPGNVAIILSKLYPMVHYILNYNNSGS